MDRLPLRMEQFGDQTGPTRLMRRTDAPSGVAVEILVEQQVISEIRVGLHSRLAVKCGAGSIFLSENESAEAPRMTTTHGPTDHFDDVKRLGTRCCGHGSVL